MYKDERIEAILNELSPKELEATLRVLEEIDKKGTSSTLEDIWKKDYEEIPVSIDEYIESPDYIGSFTGNGSLIYPYWRGKLREMFDDNGQYQEIAVTGCLTGDTMIPLLNGRTMSMLDLCKKNDIDEYVYSYDVNTNRYVPGHLVDAFSTGIKRVYKVTLDNGDSFKCTSNHKFMTRDKKWKSIDTGLSIGDSLMPFNTSHDERDYEIIKHPQPDGTFVEEPTHRMVMRWKIGSFKGIVHHKDFDKHNNDPRNLMKTTWSAHTRYHRRHVNRLNYDPEFQKKCHDGRWNKPGAKDQPRRVCLEMNKNHPTKQKLLKKYSKESVIDILKTLYNPRELIRILDLSEMGYWCILREYNINPNDYIKKSPIKFEDNKYWSSRFKIYNRLYNEYGDITDEIVRNSNVKGITYPSNVIKKYFDGDESYFKEVVAGYNHKIVAIEYVGEEEVFDLTVEKYHNFVISSGVVAHNSIGTGKSTVSCIAMSYLLYKTMCLKNPQEYYRLAAGSTIVFAFFNNTLDLTNSVGYGTLQNIVQNSPWFMARGKVTGTKYKEWIPDKLIRFRVGSQASHALGTNIISCLTGDTIIMTSDGECPISNLANKEVEVVSVSEDGNLVLSDPAKILLTKYTSELIRIELEDGTTIRCTPEHRFMLTDGSYKRADELSEDDDLMTEEI